MPIRLCFSMRSDFFIMGDSKPMVRGQVVWEDFLIQARI